MVFVGLVVHLSDANVWVVVTMIALFCALAMRWGVVNYGFASFAIAGAVLFFVTTPGDTALGATGMRLRNTFIGLVVASLEYAVDSFARGTAEPPQLPVAAGNAGQLLELSLAEILRDLDGRSVPDAGDPAARPDLTSSGDQKFDRQLDELVTAAASALAAVQLFNSAK